VGSFFFFSRILMFFYRRCVFSRRTSIPPLKRRNSILINGLAEWRLVWRFGGWSQNYVPPQDPRARKIKIVFSRRDETKGVARGVTAALREHPVLGDVFSRKLRVISRRRDASRPTRPQQTIQESVAWKSCTGSAHTTAILCGTVSRKRRSGFMPEV
jgi:hypothetical protein